MTLKQVNDAAAYIRGLAHVRGRNADWAKRAARETASLPAEQALKRRVIDYAADDVTSLAMQLDGKKATVLAQNTLLQPKGAVVIGAQPDWRAKLLAAITNPTIALPLMTIGIYGLFFMNPGIGVPGVVGTICQLLAL